MQNNRSLRICLVTPGHLSTNPRLVKEAEAFASAGYEVNIVAARFIAWADEADREFANAPWRVTKVAFGPMAGLPRRLQQSLYRRICLQTYKLSGHCADLAFHPAIPALARAACSVPADLYIAHNLAALPAAAKAARMHGAKLGFDAEDFHSGELPDTPDNAFAAKLTRAIEQAYLPRCDYLTAASPGIAEAYADAYGVKKPAVILNVFPKSDAPIGVTEKGNVTRSPSLYWFSQTVGPNRGLETVIQAVALSRSRPVLFMRGNSAAGYQEKLTTLATEHGVADRLCFLPPAPPSEMVKLAAGYDIGIASEPGHSLNNRLALSNKLFTFLLAGIPVAASSTPAQAEIAHDMPEAVFIYPQQDAQVLADKLDKLLLFPITLAEARQSAWALGQERFNWDIEQHVLLQVVADVLLRSQEINREA